MWNDPIVNETRMTRDKIAARFNYDVWMLGKYFKSKHPADSLALISKSVSSEESNQHVLLELNNVEQSEVTSVETS